MHWLLIALAPAFPISSADIPPAEEDPAPLVREEIWTELPDEEEEEESVTVLPSEAEEPATVVPRQAFDMEQEPEILVGREPTEAAWRGVRNRLQTKFNTLREGMLLPADAWDLEAALDTWLDDLDVFAEYAVALASDDIAEVNRHIEVLGLLSNYLAIDYETGNPVRIEATMRQMDQLLQRLEMKSVQADARAGRVDRWGYAMFPADWGEPRYRDRLFADSLTFRSAAELSVMARERQYHLSRAPLDRMPSDVENVARELVEISRTLARRQSELPDLSRPGFRNVAMRMEVIAENIVEFSRARDRHGTNRQVILLGEAVREMDSFLLLTTAAGP